MAGKPKLMISYCHADKTEATRIRNLLNAAFEILIDEDYFQLSRSTKPEMKRMVGDADLVLVLLSPDSVKSSAVRYEVSCALAREAEEQRTILFAGMIDRCKPMPEWDATRLYANLHSNFAKDLPKLKRSLAAAARKALPRATAIPDSQALDHLARASLTGAGFKMRGDVEMLSRTAELPDNPFSARLLNLDNVRHFSVFLATFGTWTCFFYVPKHALVGKSERLFAFERSGVRSSIAARLHGYLSQAKRSRAKSPQEETLIRLFRRFPRQIDVILSPYSVATSYVKAFDVKILSWPGTKVALFYQTDSPYAGVAILPILVAPGITNREKLSDAVRALQSALRVELRAHHATEEKWSFLGTGALGSKSRRIKIQPKRPRN